MHLLGHVVQATFLSLVSFEYLDLSMVSAGESIIEVAYPSLSVAPMTVHLLVSHLYVDHLIISPHFVSLPFFLIIIDVR